MKNYVLLSLSCALFITSTSFVILQGVEQEKPEKNEKAAQEKADPLRVPSSSKSDDLIIQLDQLTKELAADRKKNDSVNAIRQSNFLRMQKSESDLKKANDQYHKSLKVLKFVLDQFPADSVMKYYGEYKEGEDDTVKKKIESEEIAIPSPKKSIWNRIFGGKRNH